MVKRIGKLPEDMLRQLQDYLAQHYDEMACFCVSEAAPRMCSAPQCMPSCTPMAEAKTLSLEEVLRQADAGFSETLLRLIDEAGKKDSQVYKQAGLTKQHFSKIRNNPAYKPTKPTAVALALALELDLEDMEDLLERAGFALNSSSKFDLIIRFFVQQGIYDVAQINMALYEFDQPLLGSL